jgi:hypothetical protein
MLVNISSDSVGISYDGEYISVPRGGLEIELPQIIIMLYHQKKLDKDIYVVNGPGSFTNLRIGCLVLNMLKSLMREYNWTTENQSECKLYTIDKPTLYTNLYKQWAIPSQGLMYIGQQKNYWICNLEQQTFEKTLIDFDTIEGYFPQEHWIDQVSAFESSHMLTLSQKDVTTMNIRYKLNVLEVPIDKLGFVESESLSPNYIIQPNIGP